PISATHTESARQCRDRPVIKVCCLNWLAPSPAGAGFITSLWFQYLVLALQANTAFADFPRLCRAVAQNGFLPRSFAARGRRLVYSNGIYVLVFLAGSLLVIFGGVTDRL